MLIIFFIFGLIVGSFLNVLVYRLHIAEEVFFDRSKCPHCKKKIRWFDNIPVLSFVLLHARCRDCQKKISVSYPLVEIFTGLIFIAIGWKFFVPGDSETWLVAAYYLIISSALIVVLAYDWLYMEIPTAILWTGTAAAVFFNLILDWSAASAIKTHSGVLAAFISFLFFFLLSAFSREKWMGMGDAYLVILLGLILGWPEIILALFGSFFIGSIYGLIVVAAGRKKLKSRIPFAPFLVLGTFISIFFYDPIINWYLSLFFI